MTARANLCSMINIFESFLPQLLRYPNPTDPLNGEAAALLMREPTHYDSKVRGNHVCMLRVIVSLEYVKKYASQEAYNQAKDAEDDDDDAGEMSSIDSFSDQEAAGGMDDL